MQLGTVLIQGSGSTSSKILDLTSPGQLARFPLPYMNSLSLSKVLVRLESCWLPSRYGCHTCTFRVYHAGHCCVWYASWLGGTLSCFSPLAACTPLSCTMKTNPSGGSFQVRFRSSLESLAWCFQQSGLISNLQETIAITCIIWRVSWTPINNDLKLVSHGLY